jgi:hypothetical protein
MRHPAKFTARAVRAAQQRTIVGLDAMADAYQKAGRDQAADRVRRVADVLGRRARITCGYCGATGLTDKQAEAHIRNHANQAQHEANQRRGRVPPVRPVPRLAKPVRQAASPAASPTAVPRTESTGGRVMSGTTETQAVARAAHMVGEMDPSTAWDLDAQLAGLANAALALAENVGEYTETLAAIRVDPRVNAHVNTGVAQLAEIVKTFADARRTLRRLYAAQFEAAESGVSQVRRDGFWDMSKADAAA